MCFARSFRLLESIHKSVRDALTLEQYSKGCLVIAHLVAQRLRDLGYTAQVELVGLKSRGKWIPHFVVRQDGEIVDLKGRVAGYWYQGKLVQTASRLPLAQIDGFYPDGRSYLPNPTAADFTESERRNFLEFLCCRFEDTTWFPVFQRIMKDKFSSCL